MADGGKTVTDTQQAGAVLIAKSAVTTSGNGLTVTTKADQDGQRQLRNYHDRDEGPQRERIDDCDCG